MSKALKTLIALGLAHALLECFSGVWPIYKHLAGLDLVRAGLMASVTMVVASLLQPLFGLLADRGYARGMVLAGVWLTFLMAFLGPAGDWFLLPDNTVSPGALPNKSEMAYLTLGILLLLSRLGHSMFHPPSVTLAHQALSEQPAAGLGLFVAAGWLGVGVSQSAFSYAFLHADGHTEVLLIPGILLVIFIAIWCQPGASVQPHRGSWAEKFAEIYRLRRSVGCLFAINLMLSAGSAALFFFLPELLEEKHCPDWLVNGGALMFWMAGTAVGVTLGGYGVGRTGPNRMLIMSLAINFLAFEGFLLLPVLPGAAMVPVCLAAGVFTGLCQPLPLSLSQSLSPKHASLIGGMLMGWTWALGNLSPTLAAWLVSDLDLSVARALLFIGLVNLAAVLFAFTLPRAKPATDLPTDAPAVPPALLEAEAEAEGL